MTALYDTRPVSVTIPRNHVNFDLTYDGFTYHTHRIQEGRLRSDSLPEPRHFRHLRRELSIDSDLDKYKHTDDPIFPAHELKQWKTKRVTHKQVESLRHDRKADVVVISTDPLGSPTPVQDSAVSPTFAITNDNVPWTNWSKWNLTRGKIMALIH